MVGPISQGERDAFNRKLQVGVAVLVAGSTALVALGAGATLGQAALAAVAGVLVGGVISWYIVPTGLAPAEKQRLSTASADNPFTDGGDGEESDPDERERNPSKSRSRRR
jgi:hypothetical protein